MNLSDLKDKLEKYDERPFFWLLIILLAVFAFHGKPLPYGNEFIYLIKLKSGFLPNDWTLSQPANEHWLFNVLFGSIAKVLSVEVVGWFGRLAVWTVCGAALMKIGRLWGIKYWMVTSSIIVWLAMMQGYLVDEWIFGGFEAKTVAYCFLLFSLLGFSTSAILIPSILLGLTFSFHPVIGLWGGLAIGLSLLLSKTSMANILKSAAIASLFALPTVLVILLSRNDFTQASINDWEFVVRYVFPFHHDAATFNNRDVFWLFVMFAFNIASTIKSKSFALIFLSYFQIFLCIFFILGLILRWFELYSLLAMMPMRLFPLFVPLFFLFSAFHLIARTESRSSLVFVTALVSFVIGIKDPTMFSLPEVKLTIKSWTAPTEDLEKTYKWIAENTAKDAMILSPPIRRSVWYLSERATVATFRYPVYERLSEWRSRIDDLTNGSSIPQENVEVSIENAFNALNEQEIIALKNKYGASHLISRGQYSFPLLYETVTYKVYDLREVK